MTTTATVITCDALVPGEVEGEAFRLAEPLSFWGGYDAADGRVSDRWHPDHGTVLAGRVVLMERGRGSSSGASVLGEAIRLGTAPAALVMRERDPIVTVGALVALELYGRACPIVVVEDAAAFAALARARRLGVVAGPGGGTIRVVES